MSAQGGTIAGRAPMHLPIRPIALLLAVVTAAAVGMTAVRLASDDGRTEPAVAKVEFGSPTTGHPTIRDRHGVAVSEMPVQRLYPDGFGDAADDEPTVIFDGRRRKW